MPSTAAANFAAYDAETAVGRGEDQRPYLEAVAADKRAAVDKIEEQLSGLRERLRDAKTELKDAEAAVKAIGQEGGADS